MTTARPVPHRSAANTWPIRFGSATSWVLRQSLSAVEDAPNGPVPAGADARLVVLTVAMIVKPFECRGPGVHDPG